MSDFRDFLKGNLENDPEFKKIWEEFFPACPQSPGTKRRYPSKFDIPCSEFDIPAAGGFFFERSLEKDDVILSVNFLFFWQEYFGLHL